MFQSGVLSHVDPTHGVHMVDVGGKPLSLRSASARGVVELSSEAVSAIRDNNIPKGDVLQTAQLAGIMAAKRTSDLIPLCHPLLLSSVDVICSLDEESCCVQIESTVVSTGQTGVEMEALTAVSVAALTIYDMCKSVDRSMTILQVYLEEKKGGQRGDYRREEGTAHTP